jgi:hypothetical protein
VAFEQAPLVGSHVPATWQESLAVHVTGLAPTHAPAWQLSLCVQALPSLHAVPFAAAGLEHCPVVESHVPATWQESLAVQVTGLAPTHAPAWQLSLCVQALPSLHDVPFAAAGLEQAPLVESHVPATWQESLAAHATGFEPAHTPAWQLSLCVHGLPSLHTAPSGFDAKMHWPVSPTPQAAPRWHASGAGQVPGDPPGAQEPDWHLSPAVH